MNKKSWLWFVVFCLFQTLSYSETFEKNVYEAVQKLNTTKNFRVQKNLRSKFFIDDTLFLIGQIDNKESVQAIIQKLNSATLKCDTVIDRDKNKTEALCKIDSDKQIIQIPIIVDMNTKQLYTNHVIANFLSKNKRYEPDKLVAIELSDAFMNLIYTSNKSIPFLPIQLKTVQPVVIQDDSGLKHVRYVIPVEKSIAILHEELSKQIALQPKSQLVENFPISRLEKFLEFFGFVVQYDFFIDSNGFLKELVTQYMTTKDKSLLEGWIEERTLFSDLNNAPFRFEIKDSEAILFEK